MKCTIDKQKLKKLEEKDEGNVVHVWNKLLSVYTDATSSFVISRDWNPDLVNALRKQYTLREAILIASFACTACQKELAFQQGLSWGEAKPIRVSSCIFCTPPEDEVNGT